MESTRFRPSRHPIAVAIALSLLIAACVVPGPGDPALHRWWSGLGPVLPHDTFPADCKLCHVGSNWNQLVDDFKFDHEKQAGVKLQGAHAQARCLLCHNDRGPIKVYAAKGCVGCHEDIHQGELSQRCTDCHGQRHWRPQGMVEKHNLTRFPLTGAHASVSCVRCHIGARAGNFVPTNNECVGCHQDDLNGTTNPPHIPLGWVDRCDRCHTPTRWRSTR